MFLDVREQVLLNFSIVHNALNQYINNNNRNTS